MNTILLFAVLCCGPVFESTWQVDRPALEIVEHLAAKLPRGTGEHLPPDITRLLDVVRVYAAVEAWPADHYYRVTIRMLQAPNVPLARRLNRCEKTLEVWARGDVTIVRSRLDIGWGPEGWLSERILRNRVWPRVRDWERSKLAEIGR
jgi:hypothetical protein